MMVFSFQFMVSLWRFSIQSSETKLSFHFRMKLNLWCWDSDTVFSRSKQRLFLFWSSPTTCIPSSINLSIFTFSLTCDTVRFFSSANCCISSTDCAWLSMSLSNYFTPGFPRWETERCLLANFTSRDSSRERGTFFEGEITKFHSIQVRISWLVVSLEVNRELWVRWSLHILSVEWNELIGNRASSHRDEKLLSRHTQNICAIVINSLWTRLGNSIKKPLMNSLSAVTGEKLCDNFSHTSCFSPFPKHTQKQPENSIKLSRFQENTRRHHNLWIQGFDTSENWNLELFFMVTIINFYVMWKLIIWCSCEHSDFIWKTRIIISCHTQNFDNSMKDVFQHVTLNLSEQQMCIQENLCSLKIHLNFCIFR